MLELIFILVISAIIGWGSHYFCTGLDRWMDYAGIFYNLRLKKFLYLVHENRYDDILEDYVRIPMIEIDGELPIVTHTRLMSELFWKLADREHSFKLWVCVECMSMRFNAVMSLILVIFAALNFGWIYIFSYPLIVLVSTIFLYKTNGL